MLFVSVKLASVMFALPHVACALLLFARAPDARPASVAREPLAASRVSTPPSQSNADAPPPALTTRDEGTPLDHPARVLRLHLEHGEPVPEGRPNTWVHIPASRDAAKDVRLAFIFHGFKNCIDSYTSRGIQCTPTNIRRPGYDIAAQLEREGAQSIVVVPETSYDVPDAEAPTLARHGAFRQYAEEVLAAIASETHGAKLEDVTRLALIASSGGYQALEPILDDNESIVTDVLLLDAAYMYPNSAVGRFFARASRDQAHHIGLLYTPSGGALTTSESLKSLARSLVSQTEPSRARFGRVRGDPSLADLSSPIYVLRVDEEHDVVVRRNLGRVIASAGL